MNTRPRACDVLRAAAFYVALLALILPFLLPLFWMISTSLKPAEQIYASPPQWIPHPITLQNLQKAWTLLDFGQFTRNSLLVTGLSLLGTLFSSSLVGYAFATLSGRGKQVLFALLLATVMVPSSVTLIPRFILFSKLGWANSYAPLIVPRFFADAFYVFLFRQFFRSLPRELFESAELDGCNPFTTYWRIALPLALPALATVAIFAFIASWNDFLEPLIYLSSNERYTLSLGLALFQGLYYTQLHYLMPLSLLALTPVLLIFVVAQRYLVQGIVTTPWRE
jgi:multiple sugar transport system permease protein